MTRGHRQVEQEADGPGSGRTWPSAGKKSLTDGLQLRRRVASPPPSHELAPRDDRSDDLSSEQSFVDSIVRGPVQKKDKAKDKAGPPVEHKPKHDPAQGVRPATGVKLAFFFTGEDAFGKAARAFVAAYYPDHWRFEARSFEDMFAIMANHLPTILERAENDRVHIDEIVMVSHANASGGMKIPLYQNRPGHTFSPAEVKALQTEVQANEEDATHKLSAHVKALMKQRDRVLGAIDRDTRVVIRGCEIGKSPEAMEGLRLMFGGDADIMAPREFQGYQLETIGPNAPRLKTELDAHAMLVKNGYLNEHDRLDLEELEEAERKRVEALPDEEAKIRALKTLYIRKRFPSGIPTEFFVVGETNYAALKGLKGREKVSEKAEPFKTRPDEPYRLSFSDTEGENARWARSTYSHIDSHEARTRMSLAQCVEEAEELLHPWDPKDAGRFLRLYERCQDVNGDTSVAVTRMPAVFSDDNVRRARADLLTNPDRSKDALRAGPKLDPKTVDTNDYSRATEMAGTVAPNAGGSASADPSGVDELPGGGLRIWGFPSNASDLGYAAAAALEKFRATVGPSDRVRIAGHTDGVGPADINVKLSRHRAESVAAALVRLGVDATTLDVDGRGLAELLEPEVAGPGVRLARARNRRVELHR